MAKSKTSEAEKRVFWAMLPTFFLVGVGLYVLFNCSFSVQPHEQAVVLRTGKLIATKGPGLHFKIPVIDEVILVSIEEHSLRLPDLEEYYSEGRRRRNDTPESLMLTADLNAAVVEWTVQWRVQDPAKFLFSIDAKEVDAIMVATAMSVMHRMVGDYSIDEVLTGKREEVSIEALKGMQTLLDSYDSGIAITGLQMQRVTPPERVKPAFDAVNASIQLRDKLVNEANKERNRLIPSARARKDKMIREAQGYADRKRAEATGEINALKETYQAYKEAPEINRTRLYLEAMEEIVSQTGPKILIDPNVKGLLPFLNVESGTAVTPSESAEEAEQ